VKKNSQVSKGLNNACFNCVPVVSLRGAKRRSNLLKDCHALKNRARNDTGSVMLSKSLYRILDANLNRAKEGIRVCEDLCRYIWNQRTLTRAFKDLRHQLTAIASSLDLQKALEARFIQGDVGRGTSASESKREDIKAVLWANSQRVKESLRVLEEVVKLIDTQTAVKLKALRYKMYALEQKVLSIS
jgi:hypothetical protein